ncbi:hypothetical protein NitYY0826_C1646 [Nitratiruptor sp. YY08-26]|uniref:hypothetical protein n=1 Tax=unclassified Nitratiruptor TaxID=2624044 RepID=UPI0019164E81|nr:MULTISPECIES: hypothetical protein [unclassified Nitratiruptor]BCD62763.1 hypothetical protein NitYY0813_C1644 [Nitratiruptor sp. YY08-13]BCD66699.1 hypothetical protein NitYY0826_C1646 [Nitratiruptor sp. YY08-26]
MQKRYLFFDAKGQSIHLHSTYEKATPLAVVHDGWIIELEQKEFNKLRAADTTASIISPWSYLYLHYMREAKEHALFIAILEEHIFAITFANTKPMFWQIYEKQKSNLTELIEDFLKKFYAQEESYFIESIYIYDFAGTEVDAQEIEEKLFIPVIYKQCSSDELDADDIETYAVSTEERRESLWKRYKALFGVVVAFFLVLIGYEFYLRNAIASYQEKIEKLVKLQVETANTNNVLTAKLMQLKKLTPFINELKQVNPLIVERIRSVFDLVPANAYLTKAEFNSNELILEGICKDRDTLLHSLHEKLSQTYKKGKISFSKRSEGFYFKALYKEMREKNE